MNNEVHSGLNGTGTEENINSAFNGEARSHMKYLLYSDAAIRNGDPVLAGLLMNFAENEKQHAEIWLEYLGELGNEQKNIEAMLSAEQYETDVMYPEFAKTAREEGFSEIADKMMMTAEAEKNHARLLNEYLTRLKNGTRYAGDEDTEWLCTNCGYLYKGADLPERCPLCSYTRPYFARFED